MNKALAVALALTWTAGAASAQDGSPPARSVRLIGEALGAADPVPQRFVLDLRLTKGDSAFQSDVKGWFAGLPPTEGSGEISGTCVSGACALSVDVANGKLSLSGDMAEAAVQATGRYALADDDDKPLAAGAVRFTPLSGDAVDALGQLASPGAVDAAELRDLLMWVGIDQGFSNADDTGEPPDDIQLDGLASWQQAQGRPMTGLIFAADLAQLRAAEQSAKAAAGWTPIGSEKLGWSAAYPARLLPRASETAGGHRFVSTDGRASLVITIAPKMADEQFDALVEKLSDDTGRPRQNFTRVNGDMLLSYVDKGAMVTVVYRNHARGLGELVFTRPQAADATYAVFDAVLPESLKVSDEAAE